MGETCIGKCTNCGKENETLAIIDETSHICLECLAYDYFYCDVCRKYWNDNYVNSFYLKTGITVCEYCIEDYNAEFEERNENI